MLAIKVLLELRDVITMREQQEGIVYVSSIKGGFKLYGTILQPFTLIIAHEGVSKDGAEASTHANTIRL